MHLPLFTEPSRITLSLDPDWIADLRSTQPSEVRIDDGTIERLRYEAGAHAATLHIASLQNDQKAVEDQLMKLRRRAVRVLEPNSATTSKWIDKLKVGLAHRPDARVESERARLIAVEHIALKFLVVERMRAGLAPGHVSRRDALQSLSSQDWNPTEVGRLVKFIDQALEEFRRGCYPGPFDTLKARLDFAGQLVQLYRWMGGSVSPPHEHAMVDGARPRTPFMFFLDAMRDTTPLHLRRSRDSFYSPVRAFLRAERKRAC